MTSLNLAVNNFSNIKNFTKSISNNDFLSQISTNSFFNKIKLQTILNKFKIKIGNKNETKDNFINFAHNKSIYNTTKDIFNINKSVFLKKINTTIITLTTKTITQKNQISKQMIWEKNKVDLSIFKNFKFNYINCIERNRLISEKLTSNPLCDCPIDQFKNINGCKTSDVAIIRVRLIRLCNARLHFNLLSSKTQAAIIFLKVRV